MRRTRGRVARGYMGVGLHELDLDLQRSLHLQVSQGAVVQDVTAGSPAQQAPGISKTTKNWILKKRCTDVGP